MAREFDFESVMQMSKAKFNAIPIDKKQRIVTHRIQYLKRELRNPESAEKIPQIEALIAELEKVLE